MIDGFLDWQEHGLVLPDIVKQATNAYFEDEDVFGRWISEKCQCAPGLKSKAIALYESWREFAEANGEDPGSMKAMAEQLAQRGFKKIKSDGVKYLGIGLLPISTQNFGNEM
jgi:putative DNA primase/helicase